VRLLDGYNAITETDFTYTNQRSYMADTGFGLMDYHARFYSPTLGRFTQPDSIIPDLTNSQAWNRYSYSYNNPVKYTDPSGHRACDWDPDSGGCYEDPVYPDVDWHPLNSTSVYDYEPKLSKPESNNPYGIPYDNDNLPYGYDYEGVNPRAGSVNPKGWPDSPILHYRTYVDWKGLLHDEDFVLDMVGTAADLAANPVAQVPATFAEGAKTFGDLVTAYEFLTATIKGTFEPIMTDGTQFQNGMTIGPFREEWSKKEEINVGLDLVSVFPGIGIVTSIIGAGYNASFYIHTEQID